MGGTSFDIGLVVDGQPRVKPEGEFEGYPVKIPLIDVEGIGAGGGSVAWVDAGGALNVGPQSAGASPGPACYGLGGELPTVTDANLVLGRLNPEYFLGGEMPLYPDKAREAIEEHIARPLGLSLEEAAAGILRVVNANMVRGISVNTTQKGYDVREFSLLAFGGAGPLHAVELGQELGVRQVIIPPYCSVFSAFGAVASDLHYHHAQTVALSQAEATAERLTVLFRDLEQAALRQVGDGKLGLERRLEWAVDLRYEGQSYELTVPIAASGPDGLTAQDVQQTVARFHDLHLRIYAYGEPDEPVEFVSLRVAVIDRVPEVRLEAGQPQAYRPEPRGERPVYFFGRGFIPTAVYHRDDLRPGAQVEGPAVVEEQTSTAVLPPGVVGRVNGYGNILVPLGG